MEAKVRGPKKPLMEAVPHSGDELPLVEEDDGSSEGEFDDEESEEEFDEDLDYEESGEKDEEVKNGDLRDEVEEGENKVEKLPEGFYAVEAVRKKRVRQGEPQYLIKWVGWPEASNRWEPMENLLSISDMIDEVEEKL